MSSKFLNAPAYWKCIYWVSGLAGLKTQLQITTPNPHLSSSTQQSGTTFPQALLLTSLAPLLSRHLQFTKSSVLPIKYTPDPTTLDTSTPTMQCDYVCFCLDNGNSLLLPGLLPLDQRFSTLFISWHT